MKKITIKQLIDFRRKSDRSKKTFAYNLQLDKKRSNDSGGDYWITSLSAISNVFKYKNEVLLNNKVEELQEKIKATPHKSNKLQFQRNIDILLGFEDFDFKSIRPEADLDFLKKPNDKSLIDIKGFIVQAYPHHVYTYSINGHDEIGAIWFVAKLGGFANSELGMFADILYRYLNKHYSKDYYVNTEYCIALDVVNGKTVSFSEIEGGIYPILIEKTIEEIQKL
tara:strand:+ start:391 stop:1062 length:672 start_codon:yes stop_codon:yes gene_type:complete